MQLACAGTPHRLVVQRLALGLGLVGLSCAAHAGTARRLDVSPSGVEANNPAFGGLYTAISADGRITAFESMATNLLPEDTTPTQDIYAFDRSTGALSLVSATPAGTAGNDRSSLDAVSPDGRYVLFRSDATDLVPGDTPLRDGFLRDLVTGTTTKYSFTDSGVPANNKPEGGAAISADNRYLAFTSHATNYVVGDNNSKIDVFLRDRVLGTTKLLSKNAAGQIGNGHCLFPTISADGRYVAFISEATNLTTDPDVILTHDVFVADAVSGFVERISLAADGGPSNGLSFYPAISGDGRFVAFMSQATNLTPGVAVAGNNVYVRDRTNGVTELLSRSYLTGQAVGTSNYPAISADGNLIVFNSGHPEICPGATGINMLIAYRRDEQKARVAVFSTDGSPAVTAWPSLADDQWVSFSSYSNSLVYGDQNGEWDHFLADISAFSDLHGGYAGSAGIPVLSGTGSLAIGTSGSIDLTHAKPSATAVLTASLTPTVATIVPFGTFAYALPPVIVLPVSTSVSGTATASFVVPPAASSYSAAFLQGFVADNSASGGVAISNLLRIEIP